MTKDFAREILGARRWESRLRQYSGSRRSTVAADPDRMTIYATIREIMQEQLDYRELLGQIVKRDLVLRYKQTLMGVGWAVFMPLVNTAVFSVIFTRVAPLDTGVPYPLYAFCGFLFWNFFASSLRFA